MKLCGAGAEQSPLGATQGMEPTPRLTLLRICGIAEHGLQRATELHARYRSVAETTGHESERIREILDAIELIQSLLSDVYRTLCTGDYSLAETVRLQNRLAHHYNRIMYLSAAPTILKHIYYEVYRELERIAP